MTTTHVGIFDVIDPPSPDEAPQIRTVLETYDFPWHTFVPQCARWGGMVKIGFEDRSDSAGFFNSAMMSLHVDPIAHMGPDSFGQVLTHELGHAIDQCVLTDESRDRIHRIMHEGSYQPYEQCPSRGLTGWTKGDEHWMKASEAFADAVGDIWNPRYARTDTVYGPHLLDVHKDRIRDIVLGEAAKIRAFKDVPITHAHRVGIEWAAGAGLITGTPEGYFKPNDPVTRGVLADVLWRQSTSINYQRRSPTLSGTVPTFSDVPADHPHREGITWAAQAGIVTGYPDGTFKPTTGVTRGQLATMLHRQATQ